MFHRYKFIKYLESLPKDRPFCVGKNCPLKQWCDDEDYPVKKIGSSFHMSNEGFLISNQEWVINFILNIDQKARFDDRYKLYWTHITPRDCLHVLE